MSNHKTKSVEGLSYAMIGSWVVGDAFKTFYFIWEKQPFQFIMCGTVQLIVDFIIIAQIYTYQKEHKAKNFIKTTWKMICFVCLSLVLPFALNIF